MTDIKGVTELTVRLLAKNAEALERAAAWTGHNQDDTVNRAIAIYDAIVGGLLLEDVAFSYIDEHNQPVELVLPAGQRWYREALAAERHWRKLANGVAI